MDLISLIKNQIKTLPDSIQNNTKIPFVLTHIERAEYFMIEAERLNDDQYYNDSVYRANQAFEGILKEAYLYFTKSERSKKNNYQIENYLLRKKVLNQRVADLLKNYRTQWRNPSTHDYGLLFNQQEALVAVVSVQMFIKVLLDQIFAEAAFRKEQRRTMTDNVRKSKVKGYENLPLLEKIAILCSAFAKSFEVETEESYQSYAGYEGTLEAFIGSFDSNIEIKSKMRSSNLPINIKAGPDFFISSGSEDLILEFKIGYKTEYVEDVLFRMSQYLSVYNPKQGLVFFYEPRIKTYNLVKQEINIDNKLITVGALKPDIEDSL